MEKIGLCPVCQEGQVYEKEYNYVCNHIKNENESCDFVIWKSFFGKEITTDIVKELIENKKTQSYSDFISQKTEKPFTASIIINEHNKVSLDFNNSLEGVECVACGGKIYESSKGYYCEGRIDETCNMFVPKIIAKKEIEIEYITLLIEGGKTEMIKGFESNNGNSFNAKLYIDDKDFKVKFDSSICPCPKCEDGTIREFEKSYSCSNYKTEVACDFSVWKNQNGGNINVENLIKLCEEGKTNSINFKSKDGEKKYKGYLQIKEDGTTKLIKE